MTVAAIATGLRPIVRAGIEDNSPKTYRGLVGLECVHRRAREAGYPADEDGLTHAAQDVVREALDSLTGPLGEAARRLFGVHGDAHGQPLAERRRQGAFQLGLMQTHFRRHREPKILREVASNVYRAEHALTDTDSQAGAVDDDGGPVIEVTDMSDAATARAVTTADIVKAHTAGSGERGSGDRLPERSPARRARDAVWPWRRLSELDAVPTVMLASASVPHPTPAWQPRHLLRQLQQLRDQQERRWWYLVVAFAGAILVWVHGWHTVPFYALGLAGLGLFKILVEVALEWRATKTVVLGERWPQSVLLVMVACVAGIVVTQPADSDGRAARQCTPALEQCDGPTTASPPTTSPSPNSVPVTYAQPTPPAAPDCPPPGNQERRLVFTAPPPMCIDPDATHVATVTTNIGTFELTLNTRQAPWVVNNFVFLALWHHYDGVTLEPWPTPGITFDPTNPSPSSGTGPYAGLDYVPPRLLTSRQPIQPGTTSITLPGYSMQFDAPPSAYPDDRELYAVLYAREQPHLFAIVISPEGHDQIAQDATTPVLGTVTRCRDLLATGSPDERTPIITSTPIVISSIEITEHRQRPTSTTAYQDHCAEDRASAD